MPAAPVRARDFPLGAAVTLDELDRDPHAVHARLRGREPVSWVPALGGWLITRHALADRVLRDAAAFTVDDPRFTTARLVGPSMLSTDGAEHTRHRAPFVRPFRPADVRARFTALVETTATKLVDAVTTDGRCEVRASVAGPLSVAVIAEALGLGDLDPATVLAWYRRIVAAVSTLTAGGDATADGAGAVAELATAIVTALRAHPTSLLGEAARAPGGLTATEIVADAAIIMFGGIDTTDGMITNLLLHLTSAPDVLRRVVADPGLLPAAVEESLRLEPAAAVVDRFATRDTALGGARVAAGELVVVSLAAANRDPDVFDHPDTFRLGRARDRVHLAFARGPHVCPGADLARMETLAAVGPLLRLPGLRVASPAPVRGLVFRKPERLELTWQAPSTP